MGEAVVRRFLRYVRFDTQSREGSPTFPSTENQKVLGLLLVDELRALGLVDAAMDHWGYVAATLPSNLSPDHASRVPVIGLLAHLDTSPEVSGENVHPIVHTQYKGGDIVLPGDPSQVIRFKDNPELARFIGSDIVTSDGTTLLGADDKAGIAEIMTALEYLVNHPDIPHGTLRICFTPDEEIGRGTDHFDVRSFGADVAYTVDGGAMGEVEDETFNAATATVTIHGINVHPGYAKGRLLNAIRIMAEWISRLKNYPAPETTEQREGYLHPYVVEGGVDRATLRILIRDFEAEGMREKVAWLHELRDQIAAAYPQARIELEIKEAYQNMRVKLDEDPRVVAYALEAVRRVGLEPRRRFIRGGTDGARLCFMGLLTPNLFTGGQNFHSKTEWISVMAMEKAVETLIQLVQIWVEKSLHP